MVTDVYSEIHRTLRNDPQLQELMGLNPADLVSLGKRIQKRARPTNLAEENLPLVTFYAIPNGGNDRDNFLVYNAVFMFDVYTSDDVTLALDISKRIVQLFNHIISPFEGVENFEARMLAQHESASDLPDSYCFTTVLHFTLQLEE